MTNENPTFWLPAFQNGDEKAAEQFWQEYFLKTVRLAKKRLGGLRLRVADEEDIALSAMNSFCGMAKKREEPIANSVELWKLLATIVRRKVNKHRQYQFAEKRQDHRMRGESVWESNQSDSPEASGLAGISGREPSPELVLEFAETLEFILSQPKAEELASLKNEGYSNSEIALRLGCSTRTVQRDLEKIRTAWETWQNKARNEWERIVRTSENQE